MVSYVDLFFVCSFIGLLVIYSACFSICSCKSDSEGKGIKRPDNWSKSRADSAKSLPEKFPNQGMLCMYLK